MHVAATSVPIGQVEKLLDHFVGFLGYRQQRVAVIGAVDQSDGSTHGFSDLFVYEHSCDLQRVELFGNVGATDHPNPDHSGIGRV